MSHEELLIKTFVHPSRQERFHALLTKQNGRSKLTDLLAHRVEFDPRYATKVPTNEQSVVGIEKLLKTRGATSTCYLFSENPNLDQRDMQLTEALVQVVGGGMGTFISCIPGKLAYFESEEIGERYILWAAT